MQPFDPHPTQSSNAAAAERLAARRRALGLSEHDLARRIGVSVEAVAALEAGETVMTVDLLTAAAYALATTPAALLGEVGAVERFLLGLNEADTRALLQAFAQIRADDVRAAIVGLVEEMASTNDFRQV
jgi:transcriptional regulator with XRE-family HTH domain